MNESFRSAYDILVRPRGAQTELERGEGLVQANFQSGIYGGITEAQWKQILDLPGVEVAAPVANVGYILTTTPVRVQIPEAARGSGERLYRVRSDWSAVNGSAVFPGGQDFSYVTGEPDGCSDSFLQQTVPGRGRPDGGFPANDPTTVGRNCFIGVPDPRGGEICFSLSGVPGTTTDCTVEAFISFSFPMLISAIDPQQESKLVGLDSTVVDGRMLTSQDTFTSNDFGAVLPVLVSSRTYDDVSLRLTVQQSQLPEGTDFLTAVTRPAPLDPAEAGNDVYQNLLAFPTTTLRTEDLDSQQLYDLARRDLPGYGYFSGYWTAGPVSYARAADSALAPATFPATAETWRDGGGFNGYAPVAPTNADTQYRELEFHKAQDQTGVVNSGSGQVVPVGTFDPQKLPGFDPLSQVPLEAYSPPVATTADPATERVLGGSPYRPTLNVGGYLTEPPFMLTTIAGVHGFTDPRFYAGGNDAAPISDIRVRVAGVTGADEESLARITLVAADIATRTGLDVDITAGSSPQPQTVRLPASPYGTPSLLLSENWVAKGVAIQILTEIDRKSLALLGLILVVSVLFLVNAGVAAVRTRRPEFATLLSLGWRTRTIFTAVFAELVTVGLVAGAAGTALALAISAWFGLDQPIWRLLLVVPVSVLLAAVSGLVPATMAARGSPLDALAPPWTRGKGTIARGVTSLAVRTCRGPEGGPRWRCWRCSSVSARSADCW